MTAAFVRSHTGGNDKTADTSLSLSLSADVAANNTLIVEAAFDNSGTSSPDITTLTKPAGETASWVKLGFTDSPTGTGASGVVTEMWAITTTMVWPVATFPTIDITIDLARTAKAGSIEEWSGLSTSIRDSGTNAVTTGSPSATITGGQAGDVIIGGGGWETGIAPTGDSDTTNGSWSSVVSNSSSGGLDGSNITTSIQHKILTASGSQTYNPTGTSNDCGIIVVALIPTNVTASATITGTNVLGPSALVQVNASVAITGTNTLIPKPRNTMANVRSGAIANRASKRVNIGLLGASLMEGYPCTPDKTVEQFLATKLRARYPTTGSPTGYGLVPIPTSVMTGITMFTVTPGTGGNVGTSNATNGWGPNHQAWFTNGALAVPPILVGTIVGGPWSSFDIDLLRVPGYSSTAGQYRIDGGSWVSFSLAPTSGAVPVNEKLHVAATVNSTIEISIATGNASSFVIVDDVVGYKGDESKGIQVHNFGHAGYKVSQWQVDANPTYGYRWAEALQDLDILFLSDLGVNDAQAISSTQFQTDLNTFLDYLFQVHSSMAVVLVAAYDMSAGVTFVESWQNYVTVLRNTASARGIPFIDLTQLMPNTPNAIYYTDNLHSNTNGDAYNMMADIFMQAITGEATAIATMTGANILTVSAVAGIPVTIANSNALGVTSQVQVQAAPTLAGSNTLGVSALVQEVASAAISGTNAVTVTPIVQEVASPTISGTNTLVVSSLVQEVATAALSGVNALVTTPRLNVQATASITGVNALVTTPLVSVTASAVLANSNTLSVSGRVSVTGSSTLTGTNALVVSSLLNVIASPTIVGTNALVISARVTVQAAATIAGTNTLGITANLTALSSATLTNVNALTISARLDVRSSATVGGTNTLSVSAMQNIPATPTFTGVNVLAVTVQGQQVASATITGSNTLSVSAQLTIPATSTITGTNTLSAAGLVNVTASATSAGANTLTIGSMQIIPAAPTLTGTNALIAAPQGQQQVSATFTSINVLSITARLNVTTSASLTGVNVLSMASSTQASATVIGTNTVTVGAMLQIPASVVLQGTNDVALGAVLVRLVSALLTGQNDLAVGAQLQIPAGLTISGVGALIVTAASVLSSSASIVGHNILLATALTAGPSSPTPSSRTTVVYAHSRTTVVPTSKSRTTIIPSQDRIRP